MRETPRCPHALVSPGAPPALVQRGPFAYAASYARAAPGDGGAGDDVVFSADGKIAEYYTHEWYERDPARSAPGAAGDDSGGLRSAPSSSGGDDAATSGAASGGDDDAASSDGYDVDGGITLPNPAAAALAARVARSASPLHDSVVALIDTFLPYICDPVADDGAATMTSAAQAGASDEGCAILEASVVIVDRSTHRVSRREKESNRSKESTLAPRPWDRVAVRPPPRQPRSSD